MTCVSVVKQDVLPLQGHCLNRTTRCRAVFSLVSESHQRVHARGAQERTRPAVFARGAALPDAASKKRLTPCIVTRRLEVAKHVVPRPPVSEAACLKNSQQWDLSWRKISGCGSPRERTGPFKVKPGRLNRYVRKPTTQK